MPELDEVVNDDTDLEGGSPTEAEVETDDSSSAPADDQAETADEEEPTQDESTEDESLEDDPRVQAKLKAIERGYERKFQTLAEERNALKAEREELERIKAQAQRPQTTDQPQTSPWEEHDWNMVEPEVRTVAEQTYAAEQRIAQLEHALAQLAPTVQETSLDKQKAQLQREYGEVYDDELLMATARANPTVPLSFVAAAAFKDRLTEQAAKKTYSNVEAKRKATQPTPSNAKTTPNVDTSNWGVRDFFNDAKKTGGRRL